MQVIYEDNHLIIVNKSSSEIVQGDKTGDTPLADIVKSYIKEKYHKPGNVFLGVVHRLDRPVSGLVVFARTGKALARMNTLFRTKQVSKTYLAVTTQSPPHNHDELINWLVRNERQNKTYICPPTQPGARQAILTYTLLAHSEHYHLLAVNLQTGRHHQIRCQLAAIGCPIKGDLKYGAPRSNPDGGISLHAWRIAFTHPVTQQPLHAQAPLPNDTLWQAFQQQLNITWNPSSPS